MTHNQLAKELRELKRRRETPLPLIEMFDALLSLAPGLSAKQKCKRSLEITATALEQLERNDADRNRRLASPRRPIEITYAAEQRSFCVEQRNLLFTNRENFHDLRPSRQRAGNWRAARASRRGRSENLAAAGVVELTARTSPP
jgi:hypothetical protein